MSFTMEQGHKDIHGCAQKLEEENQSRTSVSPPCERKGLSKRGQVWDAPPSTAQTRDTFKSTDNKLRLEKNKVSMYNIYLYMYII